MTEETYTTIVSEKGQVVIPQAIREKQGLKPKTLLRVTQYKDTVILKKLEVTDLQKELQAIRQGIDEKIEQFGELSNDEINQIIAKHRAKKKPQ